MVQFLEALETELSDVLGGQLATVVPNLSLDTVNEEAELPGIEPPLVGGSVQAAEKLLAIEGLAAAVALDHLQDLRHGPLVGGEAVAALGALTAPASGAVGDAARLEGLGGGVAAGTVHSSECTGGVVFDETRQ